MKERSSWRIYKNERLGEEDRHCIEECIEKDHEAPFGNMSRFKLVDNFSDDGRIGTYGFIRGAQHYIVGAVGESPMGVEDYGYVLEKIIFFAIGLGLGICWLSGTFTRKAVIDALGLVGDEFVPASPVGYKQDRGLVDKAIRWKAGSRNRKPWSYLFFEGFFDSPLSRGDDGVYAQALEMVRIAPSASNGQGWRLVLDDDAVLLSC